MNSTVEIINLLSGSFTSPFLDYLYGFMDDPVNVSSLYSIMQNMHHYGLNQEAVKLLQLFSIIMGFPFPIEIAALNSKDAASACFVNEFLADVEGYMHDIDF